MTPAETDLAFAHHLADIADAIALRHFATNTTAWHAKADGSPVSAADEEIEHALRAHILRAHPDDAVLGEEFGATGTAHRRWIIDAIDGTASFLAGKPEWSTLIALEDQRQCTLGLVTAPALHRRWWATRGSGAWTSSSHTAPAEQLTITGADHLAEAAVGIWPPPPRLTPDHAALATRVAAKARTTSPALDWSNPAPSPSPVRKPSTGSGTCHGTLLVATGRLDAFLLLGAGPWDIAPLVPIIEEAGGTYIDLTTTSNAGTVSALFTNQALRPQIINADAPGSNQPICGTKMTTPSSST